MESGASRGSIPRSRSPKRHLEATTFTQPWSRRPRRRASHSCRIHLFVDGNKRIGHAVMETFLVLNGAETHAAVDEQERLILDLASGDLTRQELTDWLAGHVQPI